MAKKSVFITNVNSNNNLGCYCWGANGELASSLKSVEAFIRENETSTANADRAIKFYNKRKNSKGVRLMDCSGLIVYGLRSSGAKSENYDVTAEGLRVNVCKAIDKKELQDGDLCFKMSGGKAVHVGMYISGKVIESKGRNDGVVTRALALGGWSKYGRLNIKWEDEPKGYVLTRILKKGCKGSDVTELQERLLKLGYASVGKVDGDFGPKTKTAVLELQRNAAIKADGIVGKDTCKILGWIWRG